MRVAVKQRLAIFGVGIILASVPPLAAAQDIVTYVGGTGRNDHKPAELDAAGQLDFRLDPVRPGRLGQNQSFRKRLARRSESSTHPRRLPR